MPDLYTKTRQSEPHFWNGEIEALTGGLFDWRCPFCSRYLNSGYVKAHIAPVGSGIGIVAGNIVLCCRTCNQQIGKLHAFEWCKHKGIEYHWIEQKLELLRSKLGLCSVTIVVKHSEREIIRELAEATGFSAADYIRSLIEADAKSRDISFKFEVDRGGYRERHEHTGTEKR